MLKSWPTQHVRLNRHQTTTAVLHSNVTVTAAGAGGLKEKKAQEPKTKPNPPCLAGRPEPADERPACLQRDGGKVRAGLGTRGARTKRPEGAAVGPGLASPGTRGARTKPPEGAARPGRARGAGLSCAPGTAAGGAQTLRGLRHRHKMAASPGSGPAPAPRRAASSALPLRATRPRPDTQARLSRRSPFALPRDAEEPLHRKWRLTPPGPSSPHRNGAGPAVLTRAVQGRIAGWAQPRRASAPPCAARHAARTPWSFRRGCPQRAADARSAPRCRPQRPSPQQRSPPPVPIRNCAMGVNKGAADLYSAASHGAPDATAAPSPAGGAEPGRGRPWAPGPVRRSRRGRATAGPEGMGPQGPRVPSCRQRAAAGDRKPLGKEQ